MSSTAFAATSPATVIDDARTELAELLDVLWAAKTPHEKLAAVAGLEKLRSVIDAVQLVVVEEVEAADDAKSDGWASAKDFLVGVSGGHQGSGATTVRLAHALTRDYTRTLEELANGKISRVQAEVICRTLDKLPVKRELRDAAEEAMIDAARTNDASGLWKIGQHLISLLDPEGDERDQEKKLNREERAAHLHRFLSITEDGMGGVRIKGRTTVEDAAAIKAALFPLAAPEPTTPGSCGGDDDCPDRGCAHDGRDPRDHGARFLDALVEGCRRLMGADLLPNSHGLAPRLNLTMDYDNLRNGVGIGTLDTGERLSASAVRRLACDCQVLPMVLGSDSEILDVGRAQRLVTPVIWSALVVRDRHCAFPGCRRPPIACDAHHIEHWLEGGETSLDNLCLLCRAHHTMIHNTPWRVRLNPGDKRPEFMPPSRLAPDGRPIRERPLRE